ncbi:conserved hypothetical protein [Frankia canadensis]|uniref:Enoyl-CoA hydratase n=1 Tax=Frankia canadensis TaxID=1836972 RepID=A0A2I2KLM9_9ACTN|nr:enoyl-CoA hydratase-related protein [Frankia canadensis]SNQ46575.1 conserved hypothetical protein [Frankia canadensis]SOU53865.1 conserved hypothetical protein [Frankia canadensis]
MSGYSSILFSVDPNGVGTITFNRPDNFNGLNLIMAGELDRALTEAASRDDVRVLVLTGAGRSFCPGADVRGFSAAGGPGPGISPVTADNSLPKRLYEYPMPTVAAINGACAGAGLGFALACDLRISARRAVFRSAFMSVGVAGDMGIPWLLPRLVGEATAKRISLLDEKIDAEQALRYGLVHSVHDDDDFPTAVGALTARLAALPPLAARSLKRHYLAAQKTDFGTFIEIEMDRHHHLLETADAHEGFLAFSEGRAPHFRGA